MNLVISDLHLGDGGSSDEFKQGGQEQKLIDLLHRQPDHSVILLGDVFDSLRAPLVGIQTAWQALIDLLFQKTQYWIAGNHDAIALSYCEDQYRGVPIRDVLILDHAIFLHGHQFDIANSTFKVVGDIVTTVENWIVQQTSPEVGEWGRDLEILIRGGRNKEKEVCAEQAFQHIRNFWSDNKRIDEIWNGHSHQIDRQVRDGLQYFNTGSWQGGNSDENYFVP